MHKTHKVLTLGKNEEGAFLVDVMSMREPRTFGSCDLAGCSPAVVWPALPAAVAEAALALVGPGRGSRPGVCRVCMHSPVGASGHRQPSVRSSWAPTGPKSILKSTKYVSCIYYFSVKPYSVFMY